MDSDEIGSDENNGCNVKPALQVVRTYLQACDNFKEEMRPLIDKFAKSVNQLQMNVDKLCEASGNDQTEAKGLAETHSMLISSVQPALAAVFAKSKPEFFSRCQGWLRPHVQALGRLLILLHIVEHGTLVGADELLKILNGGQDVGGEQGGLRSDVIFDAQDYFNSLLDVPDDLVRLARYHALNKRYAKAKRVCEFLRNLIAELRLLATDVSAFDLKQRVEEMRKFHLREVEGMLFDISLRNAL